MPTGLELYGGGIIVVLFLFLLASYYIPWGLWLRAFVSGAPISLSSLIAMRLRGLSPAFLVNAYIKVVKNNAPYSIEDMQAFIMAGGDVDQVADALIQLHNAGIPTPAKDLQSHLQAGGDIMEVVHGLISAARANLPLDFKTACAINLAGRNVKDAVNTCVRPNVIDVPAVTGTAKDGVQLLVKARVTVRTEIAKLVGGATEQTIIARVGQGIVAAVGMANTYKDVLGNPSQISKKVLEEGLDSGTAFQILSIDIADVDVGKNVGAELQATQAEADMRTATARAQERKAMAEATAQEMIAKTQEMQAKVVEAESQIPLAIAEAMRNGKLGVMDYYAMKNIQADTDMRSAIGKVGGVTDQTKTTVRIGS